MPPTAYLKVPYFCSGCRWSKVGFTISPASKRASRRRLDCSRQRGPRWPITHPSNSRGGGPLPLEDPRRSPRWALGALRLWCPGSKQTGDGGGCCGRTKSQQAIPPCSCFFTLTTSLPHHDLSIDLPPSLQTTLQFVRPGRRAGFSRSSQR
jgi:hypothetical protein